MMVSADLIAKRMPKLLKSARSILKISFPTSKRFSNLSLTFFSIFSNKCWPQEIVFKSISNDLRKILNLSLISYSSLLQWRWKYTNFTSDFKVYCSSCLIVDVSEGYIDVGDGCWRPYVLVTNVFGRWWQVKSPTSRVRNQHQISVTNITFWRIMMLVTDVSPLGSV